MEERAPEGVKAPASHVPPSPGAWIRLAALFYGALAALAWAWRSGVHGEPLLLARPDAQVNLPADVAVGLAVAALVVAASGPLSRTASGAVLARTLTEALGPLSVWHCVALALASGIGEELFFRGALQPHVGWIAASVLFAAAHFLPRRALWVWSVFALAAGLLLGAVFEWTGNVVAPIVAHVAINAINLVRLSRRAQEDRQASEGA